MDALVIYYSRTGNTEMVAEELAEALSCPAEKVNDGVKRSGLLGLLRSGKQAAKGSTTELEPLEHTPGDFDLVVIGTPVWGGTMSTPVRSFLEMHRDALPEVAFFCTAGGDKTAQTFTDMENCCGQSPVATLAVSRAMIKKEEWRPAVERFIREVQHDGS
ncbi:MAG: flavodoxin family protein [Thermoplasmatota archaeon]